LMISSGLYFLRASSRSPFRPSELPSRIWFFRISSIVAARSRGTSTVPCFFEKCAMYSCKGSLPSIHLL